MSRFVALLLFAAIVAPALGTGGTAHGARWGARLDAPAEPAAGAPVGPPRTLPLLAEFEPRAVDAAPGAAGCVLAAAAGRFVALTASRRGRAHGAGAGMPCAGDACLPCLPIPPPLA